MYILEIITGFISFYLAYYFRRAEPAKKKKWIYWIPIGVGFILMGLFDYMKSKR
ncbi:MAG: hypothetical protein JWQ71_733 [Pedosphaera sp.]|nr:hypothetical protein [Pedosphaera sp.]